MSQHAPHLKIISRLERCARAAGTAMPYSCAQEDCADQAGCLVHTSTCVDGSSGQIRGCGEAEAGHYTVESIVNACQAGTYGPTTGSTTITDCIDCAGGKYSASVGSASESDCIDCVAGKYVDSTGSSAATDCIDCAGGKYSASVGSASESDSNH